MKTEQVDNVHKRERKRTAAPSSRRCCAHRHRHAPNPPPGRGRAARRRPGAAWAAQRPYLGRCLARSGWRQIEHSQKRRKSSGIAAGEGGSGSGGGGGARVGDSRQCWQRNTHAIKRLGSDATTAPAALPQHCHVLSLAPAVAHLWTAAWVLVPADLVAAAM